MERIIIPLCTFIRGLIQRRSARFFFSEIFFCDNNNSGMVNNDASRDALRLACLGVTALLGTAMPSRKQRYFTSIMQHVRQLAFVVEFSSEILLCFFLFFMLNFLRLVYHCYKRGEESSRNIMFLLHNSGIGSHEWVKPQKEEVADEMLIKLFFVSQFQDCSIISAQLGQQPRENEVF